MTKKEFIFSVCICVTQLNLSDSLFAMEDTKTNVSNIEGKTFQNGLITQTSEKLNKKNINNEYDLSPFAVKMKIRRVPNILPTEPLHEHHFESAKTKIRQVKNEIADEIPKIAQKMIEKFNSSLKNRDYKLYAKDKVALTIKQLFDDETISKNDDVKPLNSEQIQLLIQALDKRGIGRYDDQTYAFHPRCYCLEVVSYVLSRIYPSLGLIYKTGELNTEKLNQVILYLKNAGFIVFKSENKYYFTHPQVDIIINKSKNITDSITADDTKNDITQFTLSKKQIDNITKYLDEAGREQYFNETTFYTKTFKLGINNFILNSICKNFKCFNKNEQSQEKIINALTDAGFIVMYRGKDVFFSLPKYKNGGC